MISIEEHRTIGSGGTFGTDHDLVGVPDVTQPLLSLTSGAVASLPTTHRLVRFYVRNALGAHMTSDGSAVDTTKAYYGPGEYFRTFAPGTVLKFIAAV